MSLYKNVTTAIEHFQRVGDQTCLRFISDGVILTGVSTWKRHSGLKILSPSTGLCASQISHRTPFSMTRLAGMKTAHVVNRASITASRLPTFHHCAAVDAQAAAEEEV